MGDFFDDLIDDGRNPKGLLRYVIRHRTATVEELVKNIGVPEDVIVKWIKNFINKGYLRPETINGKRIVVPSQKLKSSLEHRDATQKPNVQRSSSGKGVGKRTPEKEVKSQLRIHYSEKKPQGTETRSPQGGDDRVNALQNQLDQAESRIDALTRQISMMEDTHKLDMARRRREYDAKIGELSMIMSREREEREKLESILNIQRSGGDASDKIEEYVREHQKPTTVLGIAAADSKGERTPAKPFDYHITVHDPRCKRLLEIVNEGGGIRFEKAREMLHAEPEVFKKIVDEIQEKGLVVTESNFLTGRTIKAKKGVDLEHAISEMEVEQLTEELKKERVQDGNPDTQ